MDVIAVSTFKNGFELYIYNWNPFNRTHSGYCVLSSDRSLKIWDRNQIYGTGRKVPISKNYEIIAIVKSNSHKDSI
jgi:hypothetical protein